MTGHPQHGSILRILDELEGLRDAAQANGEARLAELLEGARILVEAAVSKIERDERSDQRATQASLAV